MIELNIPGQGIVQLEHLVCDVNGTLAKDGQLIEGVNKGLSFLRDRLQIHLLTANTHGSQDRIDQQLGLTAVRLVPGDEAGQKCSYLQQIGAKHCAAIGQGANDALMLKEAAIGICVLSVEGTALETLLVADLVVPDILIAIELFEKPLRMVATLRK